MTNRLGGQIQEHTMALLPRIKQLLPVNHNQGDDLAFRDQPQEEAMIPHATYPATYPVICLTPHW